MGTGECRKMASNLVNVSPVEDPSPYRPEMHRSVQLLNSSSMFEVTAEFPMFALILHSEASRCPSARAQVIDVGRNNQPSRATSSPTNSGANFSRRATYSISSLITPRAHNAFESNSVRILSLRLAIHSARG